MKRFRVDQLKDGDILAGRNLTSKLGKSIRALLGSTTNHNALIINHRKKGWGIGDMVEPAGVFVHFSHYEDLLSKGVYDVRVFRIKDSTPSERRVMSIYWEMKIEGAKYSSVSMYRLWGMRLMNSYLWTIKGMWCTRAIGAVCAATFAPSRNPFRKIYVEGMPLKKNETPRTIENRLVQGLLEDVTDQVLR